MRPAISRDLVDCVVILVGYINIAGVVDSYSARGIKTGAYGHQRLAAGRHFVNHVCIRNADINIPGGIYRKADTYI